MNEVFFKNITNEPKIVIVPANMKNVDESINGLNVENIIFVDTNPFRGISHLQKASSGVPLTIYRPGCAMEVSLGENGNGLKLYDYELSHVSSFESIEIVLKYLLPSGDENVDYAPDSNGWCCPC